MSNAFGKWIPLRNDYKIGTPLFRVPARFYNVVANILNTLVVRGGSLVRTPDGKGWQLIIGNNANAGPYSFEIIQISATQLACNSGYCQYASSPETLKAVTEFTVAASGSVYITLDLTTGTFSDPQFGTLPSENDTTSVYRIADVTFASGVITSVVQRHFGDIYESRA